MDFWKFLMWGNEKVKEKIMIWISHFDSTGLSFSFLLQNLSKIHDPNTAVVNGLCVCSLILSFQPRGLWILFWFAQCFARMPNRTCQVNYMYIPCSTNQEYLFYPGNLYNLNFIQLSCITSWDIELTRTWSPLDQTWRCWATSLWIRASNGQRFSSQCGMGIRTDKGKSG